MSLRITPGEADIKVEVKAEAVQVKKSPEVGETELNNTQENGPLKEVVIQTATPSPRKGSDLKENSTRAQDEDMKDCPADSGQLLQCTLNSLKNEHATADFTATNTAPEDENPASAQDKIPNISSLTAEVVFLENHTETKATMEHSILATHNNAEGAGSKLDNVEAEASGQLSEKNEVLSSPNTQLTAAVCQLSSISVVSQEVDKESLSW